MIRAKKYETMCTTIEVMQKKTVATFFQIHHNMLTATIRVWIHRDACPTNLLKHSKESNHTDYI